MGTAKSAFQPMEDRGDIGTFKAKYTAIASERAIYGEALQESAVADMRNEARAYLKGELENLRGNNPEQQKRELETILMASTQLHLRSYDSVMSGVVEEPLFDELSKLAITASTAINAEFGPEKPKQREAAGTNVVVLYEDAERVSDAFLRFVQGLRDKTHNKELHVKQHEGDVFTGYMDKYGANVKKLVLKNEARVLVKTGLQPGEDGVQFKCDNCCDIVRAGLAFDSIADIKFALEMVLACDAQLEECCDLDKELLGDFARSIRVTRIKNRFDTPTSGGWGDVMVNFYFEKDERRHIVELQLMHDRMMTVRKKQGAHAAYNQARTAAELLEALGVPQVAPPSTRSRKLRVTHEQVAGLGEQVEVLEQKNSALEKKNSALEEKVEVLEARCNERNALFLSEIAAIRHEMRMQAPSASITQVHM